MDERIRSLVDLELSVGDYVLSGGELPALVVIDAVLRLLPGAIDEASTAEESFSAGLLEYPQYTRPPTFRGMDVPEVLSSGDLVQRFSAIWSDEEIATHVSASASLYRIKDRAFDSIPGIRRLDPTTPVDQYG